MSGERLSPLDDSDYREIAEEIAEERKKEVEAGQEYTAVVTKEPENTGDSDYGEIAEEITEEMKAERGAEAIPEERKDERKRSAILKRVYSLLSRYIIAIMSVVVVLIITFLFFEPLCCVIEHRFTEAIVTLIAFLAVGAASMTFSIAPPQIDKVLYNLYGGVAVTFIIVIIAMQFLTPPSKEDCGFATRVPTLTAAPTPTYTMTPTSTETSTNTPASTPTPTLAARATRVWESVAILSPSEGEEVSIGTRMYSQALNVPGDH